MGVMKNTQDDRLFTGKGLLIGACFFSIYAAILFSIDPEWILWAGPMTLGALYVPSPAPQLFDNPQHALQAASVFSFLGLLTLVLLMATVGEVRFGWLTWLRAHVRAAWSQAFGTSLSDVDLHRSDW